MITPLGNLNATTVAVNEVAVEPETSVSFAGASLFVQSSRGEILKLSAFDLQEEARPE